MNTRQANRVCLLIKATVMKLYLMSNLSKTKIYLVQAIDVFDAANKAYDLKLLRMEEINHIGNCPTLAEFKDKYLKITNSEKYWQSKLDTLGYVEINKYSLGWA